MAIRIGMPGTTSAVLSKLEETGRMTDTHLERLASGYRLNHASDDAANVAIASQLNARIQSRRAVFRQLDDGVGYCQVADGALAGIHGLLGRLRELAMQVSGPVAKDAQAISHLNTEFQSALDEVNRIAKTTQFNGVKSLEGTTAPTSTRVRTLKDILGSSGAPMGFPSSITSFAQVPAGSKNVRIHLYDNGANDDLQVFTTDGRHVAGTPLTSYTWSSNGVTAANVNARVLTEANGFNAGAQYNGSGLVTSGTATVDGTTLTHSGDRNSLGDLNEVVTIPGEVTTPLVILNTGNGWYNIDATWDVMPDASAASGPAIFSPRMVMTSSEAPKGSGLGLPVVNATLAGLGLATLALGSESDAKAALSKVDDAIVQVSSYRVTFGAQMNRMQAAIMTNRAVDVADQETLSRLRDADMAEEVSGRVRDSIVASQGRSVLMQALQVTREMVSSLLRR